MQKTRPEGYEAEVPITHVAEESNLTVEIVGRIDGVFGAEFHRLATANQFASARMHNLNDVATFVTLVNF